MLKDITLWVCLLFFTTGITASGEALIDLQELKQDYILEVKKIEIPAFPTAFNPSIIHWNDSLLLSFRARDPITGHTNVVGFTALDENYEPTGDLYFLRTPPNPMCGQTIQDPRMIVISDKLYMIYSNVWKASERVARRVFATELRFDGEMFVACKPEVFLKFEGIPGNKFEKNWVPFDYNGNLLFSYTVNPHKVFFPLFGKQKCETVAYSEVATSWEWGELRGGTPAQLVDNEYLAFFHSSKVMSTTQSNGKSMPHYFMGAYTFEREPPFTLKKISSEIIVGEHFYDPPYHNTWKPLRVVFPCGYVQDGKNIIVSFGRQDHEVWIVKLDKKKLMRSLIPVQEME